VSEPDESSPFSRRLFDIGSQVVILKSVRGGGSRDLYPKGIIGVVVSIPDAETQTYGIRFMDGSTESFAGSDLAALSKYRQPSCEELEIHRQQARYYDRIIYQCVVGSKSYGLSNEDSDIDRRGIFLPKAEDQWSLFGVPEQIESESTQEAYWEYQKFLILALKANPSVLECLYSPIVEHKDPAVEDLLQNRSIFLSQLVYQTYGGYVASQFKKIQSDLRNQGKVKWKHAMHLIRLLISGIEILKHQQVFVEMSEHRDTLLTIRQGGMKWEEVDLVRKKFQKDFDRAFSETKLPERPDYVKANELLIQARRIATTD